MKQDRQLSDKFLMENIEYALKARNLVSWGNNITDDMFLNDVLPYAVITE